MFEKKKSLLEDSKGTQYAAMEYTYNNSEVLIVDLLFIEKFKKEIHKCA